MGKNRDVAAVQTKCDRCGGPLVAGAAYCDRCGQRTRKAASTVRFVLRIELLALLLMAVLIAVFTWVFLAQGMTR